MQRRLLYSMPRIPRWAAWSMLLLLTLGAHAATGDELVQERLTVIVMDPLAAPLACDCVKGYAQRQYGKLGEYLQSQLGCQVDVHWSESLVTAMQETHQQADLIIGKDSVVRANARELKRELLPLAQLTDQDGKTTQTGLFVVLADDPAQIVEDLEGYRIFFGPGDCDEKSAAANKRLEKAGVSAATQHETCQACSVAALKLVELGKNVRAAAVISSYAEPLLKGCGTIGEGELRVVGTTKPVPFITAFIRRDLEPRRREALRSALLEMKHDKNLLAALETKIGFVATKQTKAAAKTRGANRANWP